MKLEKKFHRPKNSAINLAASLADKYRRIGVPTRDSFSSRIIKFCSLSQVEAESENWRIGVKLFGVESNIESSIEAVIESIIKY